MKLWNYVIAKPTTWRQCCSIETCMTWHQSSLVLYCASSSSPLTWKSKVVTGSRSLKFIASSQAQITTLWKTTYVGTWCHSHVHFHHKIFFSDTLRILSVLSDIVSMFSPYVFRQVRTCCLLRILEDIRTT